MSDDPKIVEIEARYNDVSSGPWKWVPNAELGGALQNTYDEPILSCTEDCTLPNDAEIAFLENAEQDIAYLLEKVAELEKSRIAANPAKGELERLRAAIRCFVSWERNREAALLADYDPALEEKIEQRLKAAKEDLAKIADELPVPSVDFTIVVV